MPLTNPLGDVPLTDPKAMRALAHPVRLAILSFLQRSGPATATVLAPHVQATPSVVSWHLRHLAEFGLVTDADPADVPGDRRQRWWVSVGQGFRFEGSHDPAAEMLADQMYATANTQVEAWMAEVRPTLPAEWLRHAGPSNTRVALTADELAGLADAIDTLLAPYVHRETPPDGARPVRILRHYLPLEEEDR
ncbi:helix-turn-helix domain-containing protein [Actinoplanes sp. NPDC089786]|uniref:ArsR/SmtB family transcription factor n=1 Tax=Actinoplanes sp. NPDC089786 TaxID=3155185 RepID=UPI0034388B14